MMAWRVRTMYLAAMTAMMPLLASPALAQESPAPIGGPRELLALYGFDDSYFAKLNDGTPLDDNQTEPILRGLFALRKFTRTELSQWRQPGNELPRWLADAPKHAGEVIALRGRLMRITRVRPDEQVARRFDLPHYYRCEVELTAPATTATIFALAIPRAWLSDDEDERELNERCGCLGVFLKRQSSDVEHPAPVFLTQRMAWYPEEGNFATLGNLGFDAGLVDGVRDKVSLAQSTDLEREAFYQLLDAMGRTAPGELHAVAMTELRTAKQLWETDLKSIDRDDPAAAPRGAELVRRLARAKDEAEDVTPLFNEPDQSRGRLVTLVGTARRAIEIRVDDPDVRARFGIDRYYEIELVTPDSRSNPIAVCVREMPPKMPLGENIYEPVRVTGFFLKTWGFRTAQSHEAAKGEVRKQLAPLLIGRDVQLLRAPAEPESSGSWLIAGVVSAVALVFAGAWWVGRGSRKVALPERIEIPRDLDGAE